MADTDSDTALPLSRASLADFQRDFLGLHALSEFCLIVAFISSIDEEASSADAACSVVPCDNCSAPAESWLLPVATFSDARLDLRYNAFEFLHHAAGSRRAAGRSRPCCSQLTVTARLPPDSSSVMAMACVSGR